MSFSSVLFITVLYHLVFATVANSEGLFVVEGSSHSNGQLRSLTCMSVDDDAALIWNYDLKENETSNHSSNFLPVKPISTEFFDCAIWQSDSCSVSWMNKTNWTMVNSLEEPMGPVVDYRWEGFKEYILHTMTGEKNLQNVLQVNRLDGTVIFSIRGTRDVEIRMCDGNVTSSMCLSIKIAAGGTNSVIEACLSKSSSDSHLTRNETCEEVNNVEHETAILDADEWRTFRLQWISNEKKIKLFKDIAKEAFLVAQVRHWHFVRNITVQSLVEARIRFHNYDYFLTTHKNALLTTAEFVHRDQHFCTNMLISLCPNCQLNVSLTNSENGNVVAYASIFGDERFYLNGLRTWRSIKVNMTVQNTLSTSVRLKITSVLGENNCEGVWWAIDNIRVCGEADGVRKSTITIPISNRIDDVSQIKCQKLMHGKIIVADLTASKPTDDVRRLERIVRKREKPCPLGCTKFRKVNSDSYSCRCYREISEKTVKDCLDIVLEKNNVTLVKVTSSQICTNTGTKYDLKLFEFPSNKFRGTQLCIYLPCVFSFPLEPDTEHTVKVIGTNGTLVLSKTIRTHVSVPGIVRDLSLKSGTDNVTGKWKPPTDTKGNIKSYTVTIQRISLLGCDNLKKESPVESNIFKKNISETNVSFTGLHPYARYNFTVIANTLKLGPPASETFVTKSLGSPELTVSNLRSVNKTFLAWDTLENCVTITGPGSVTKLNFSGLSDWVLGQSIQNQTEQYEFNLEPLMLLPYTQYKVRAYIIWNLSNPDNFSHFEELNFTTAPAAPPAVENFTIYEADCLSNTTSLGWKPPYPPNGIIESYQVALMNGNMSIKNLSIKYSELQKCAGSFVCFESFLLPSNTPTNGSLQLQIVARNKNVTAAGNTTTKIFQLDDLRDGIPSAPENISLVQQNYGIVTLKWMHPSFSPTKIVGFRIHVVFSQTHLWMQPPVKNHTIDYPIMSKEKLYSKELHLLTSTDYYVHIMAVDCHNRSSQEVKELIQVWKNPTFLSKSELLIEHDGPVIKLTIPAIVNCTRNTTVVVIVKGISECAIKSTDKTLHSPNGTHITTKWTAARYLVNSSESVEFIFNLSEPYGVEKLCFFKSYETYEFEVKVKLKDLHSENRYSLKSLPVSFNSDDLSKTLISTWFSAIPILIICLLLLLVYCRKNKKNRRDSNDSHDLALVSVTNDLDSSLHTSKRTILPFDEIKQRASTQMDELDVELYDPLSHPVKIEELEEFIKEALTNRLLQLHWKMLPRGFVKGCKYGYLSKNKPKNQCDYVIPYDENRVKLKKSFKKSYSDYINASYIQGYGKVKGYIATQGPKRDEKTKTDTVLDFWRLVWQENVQVICMLTNVIEDGKRKCEQYWPEVGKSVEYGDAFVLHTDNQVFVDYTIRTFQMMCRGERREIKHFHYTGWPANGVPRIIQSLAVFMRKLLATPIGEGPMIVHGSTGNGRTGTLILCDICWRQAVDEGVVDIPAVTLRLRQERANMVDTVEQYLLAHLLIAECKILERTQIPCNDRLKERVEVLRQTLPSDVQRLKNIKWQDRALCSLSNRPSIGGPALPSGLWNIKSDEDDSGQAKSSLPVGHVCRSSCFHVVSVDGIRRKEQFMVTKQPSALTLPDLGNLLEQKKIELIIVLQFPEPEKTIKPDSVPDQPSSSPLSHIKLQSRVKLKNSKYFMTEKLELIDTSQTEIEAVPITIMTCTEWTCGRTLPPIEALVSLWMASEKLERKQGPSLIICRNGVTGCGLYLALSLILEQMSLDRECDVISAVRTVQLTNPDFVQSLEQVEYLYDAAINYNAQFATYVDLL